MTWHVIDTNVIAVANGAHDAAGIDCVQACSRALLAARHEGVLVDEGRQIFEQYRRYASHAGQPGVGDAFWKWLWDNQANESVCIQVPLTWDRERETFAEFPSDPELSAFDPSDRVFVAVAIGSGVNPDILNASDTDWWVARAVLVRNGVSVVFLCPELMHD
jgi:hypothetical protein